MFGVAIGDLRGFLLQDGRRDGKGLCGAIAYVDDRGWKNPARISLSGEIGWDRDGLLCFGSGIIRGFVVPRRRAFRDRIGSIPSFRRWLPIIHNLVSARSDFERRL